jgi:hypothetical protein
MFMKLLHFVLQLSDSVTVDIIMNATLKVARCWPHTSHYSKVWFIPDIREEGLWRGHNLRTTFDIKKAKSRKSPGIENLNVEVLQYGKLKQTSVMPSLSCLRFVATLFFSSADVERLRLVVGVIRCGVSSITSANSLSLSASSTPPVGLASETS